MDVLIKLGPAPYVYTYTVSALWPVWTRQVSGLQTPVHATWPPSPEQNA
jgi:hypothetical protein